MSLGHYRCIVQALYNVVLIQALVAISCKFSSNEIDDWRSKFSSSSSSAASCTLESIMGQVIEHLSSSSIYGLESKPYLPAVSTKLRWKKLKHRYRPDMYEFGMLLEMNKSGNGPVIDPLLIHLSKN